MEDAPLAGLALELVMQLYTDFGPDMSGLETIDAWRTKRIPPHPQRYNAFGILHPLYHYQVESGAFVPSAERPTCRRGGQTVSDHDAAYYPDFDAPAARAVHPGLCSLDAVRRGCDACVCSCVSHIQIQGWL